MDKSEFVEFQRKHADSGMALNEFLKAEGVATSSYYCLETKNNTWADAAPEHAFILTIRASNDRLLAIYENTMDSRTSVLFEFKNSKSIRAFDCISSFFACNIQNKREKLMNAEIEFPKDLIIGYRRVIHNTETQWKSDIASSIMDFINNRF